jgi:multicomponent Na+:H+ antiporter subunit D
MNDDVLVGAPVVLALVGAGLSVALARRLTAQRVLGLVVLGLVLAANVALLVRVRGEGHVVSDLGDWPAPIGITLAVDPFSAIMLVVSALMLLAVFVYALGSPTDTDSRRFFHPVYLVLTAGVSAAFVTGDLFNLFVAFEITLISSYVLITMGGRPAQVRAGMTYVVINLIASTMFIAALALVYSATGTVNMAQLAERLAEIPEGTRTALGLLFLVIFGVKAAIFPLFFWLPDSYPLAPAPVTAIFAGLLTKVGVYSIVRTQTLLFPDIDGQTELLLWIGGLTMVTGVLGAIAQSNMRRILSFHIISQIGYMIFGIGLFTQAGYAAAIYFTVHNIVAKTALLLVAGIVEVSAGSSDLKKVSGLLHGSKVLALLYGLPALAMAGLPPTSGFVAKLALVEAGLDVEAWLIVGVSLAVSLLTLFSMTKMWNGVFWGAPEGPWVPGRDTTTPDHGDAAGAVAPARARVRLPRAMAGATAAVVAATVALAVWAGPAVRLADEAGESLAHPERYVAAVLDGSGEPQLAAGDGTGPTTEPAP